MVEVKNGSLANDDKIMLLDGKVALECEFIVKNSYLKPNDAAIVGGSLIEGIGNANSDVDIYVITDNLRREREIDLLRHFRAFDPDRVILSGNNPDAEVYMIHTVIPGERIKVDIEYRIWTEIETMSNLIRDTFDYACGSLISLRTVMNRRDLAFIHRLYNSKILCYNPALTRLQDRIGVTRFKYLIYRWKASDFSVLLDMQGAWGDHDWIRCADMVRENMVTQFHAYTHLCGNTNYNRKWIITYAKRVGVNQSLLNRYLSLLTAGAGQTEDELRSYIYAILDFVDDIFSACSEIIAREPDYPSGPVALSAIDAFFRSEAGDYSENEITYCKKAYGVRGTPTKDWFK